MRFVCPEHGEVKPERTGYSCPATGWCPKCGKMLTEEDGGIRVMTAEDAQKARPGFLPNVQSDRTAKAGGWQGIVKNRLAAFAGTVRRFVRPLTRELGLIPTRLYLLRAGYALKDQRAFTARIKKTVEEGIAKQRALRSNKEVSVER